MFQHPIQLPILDAKLFQLWILFYVECYDS